MPELTLTGRIRKKPGMKPRRMKTCLKCGKHLSINTFYRSTTSSDGHRGTCPPCMSLWQEDYNSRNTERLKKWQSDYSKGNKVYSGLHRHVAGSVAEHTVAIDLYRKGVSEITWPDIQQSGDDLHAKFKCGWRSVQIKSAPENIKTGTVLTPFRAHRPTSHVVAFVGGATGTVRYVKNGRPLPQELRP